MTYISWDQAQAYANGLENGFRLLKNGNLPQEVCADKRSPGQHVYRTKREYRKKTAARRLSGTYPDDVSEYRVYDLGGNVMEWTMTPYQNSREFFCAQRKFMERRSR